MAARLPRTMTPLGLVLFGEWTTGSFSGGALLVGAHAAGDVLAAPWIGRHLGVRVALLAEAGALFALIGAGLAQEAPLTGLVALAAAAGAASAGVPGEQRARLAAMTPPAVHRAAFSLESTASALLYAVGPALVGLLAVLAPAMALAVAAGISSVGALSAVPTPRGSVSGQGERPGPPVPSVADVFRLAWPSYLGAAGFMLGVTSLDVVVPAQLGDLGHDPRLAGLLLGVFALTGTIGGLVYGSRDWPGSASRQALVLILLLCGSLTILPLIPAPWAMVGLLAAAGLLGPPALVARSLTLQERLPPAAGATGFSGLSAAAGLGTSAAGLLAAPLLFAFGPAVTLLAALSLTALAALVSASREAPPATPG